MQVDVLSFSKHKQLQRIEALQVLQQSLPEVCRHDPNKLEGLAMLLHLPGLLSQVFPDSLYKMSLMLLMLLCLCYGLRMYSALDSV